MTGRGRLVWALRPGFLTVAWLTASTVLAANPSEIGSALAKGWMWLTTLTLASLLIAPLRGADLTARIGSLAVVLPPGERVAWRAEMVSVLDAAEDEDDRHRQLAGFVLALPATALTCWRLNLTASSPSQTANGDR